MKTKQIVLIVVVVLLIIGGMVFYLLSGQKVVPDNKQLVDNANEPLIGGQTDEGGCLIAAGYFWCEPKQKCLRIWEESCYEDYEAQLKTIFADKYDQMPEETNVKVVRFNDNFASGSISFGLEPGEGGAFLARLINDNWTVDYDGNGSIDCLAIKNLGYPQDVLEGFCD